MGRALLALLLAPTLAGCSLVWGPGPPLPAVDVGVDSGVDAGPFDLGQDFGPPDSGLCGFQGPEDCTTEIDEDCNGQSGCNDFACASRLECCGDSRSTTEEDWRDGLLAYERLPRGDPGPDFTVDGDQLVPPGGSQPRALWSSVCTPLAFGAQFGLEMSIRGLPCDDRDSCAYSAFVLTRASDMTPGESLLGELVVRVYDDGVIEVREGTAILDATAPEEAFGNGVVGVDVTITPGVNEDGAAVFLEVIAIQPGADDWSMSQRPVWPASLLPQWGARCRELGSTAPEADGLFFAIEARGDDVRVGPVTTDLFECANPSNFTSARPIDPDLGPALDLQQSWTAGGVGAPTVVSFARESGDRLVPTWEIWVDGADEDRSDVALGDPTFLIGGAVSNEADGLGPFSPRRPEALSPFAGRPILGGDLDNYRDPALFAPITPDSASLDIEGRQLRLVYAAEEMAQTGVDQGVPMLDSGLPPRRPEAYALYFVDAVPSQREVGVFEPDDPLLSPTDVEGCDALRDPLLVPRIVDADETEFEDLLLFFSCADRNGTDSIYAATVTREGAGSPIVGPAVRVLPPPGQTHESFLGDFAADGVAGPEIVTEVDGGDLLYRMWFVADRGAERTVGFAEGTLPDDPDAEEVPVFVPYPGNPILAGDDLVFGASCADCAIEGLAVSRVVEQPSRYRVIVARSVPDGPATIHQLVPLDQVRPPAN